MGNLFDIRSDRSWTGQDGGIDWCLTHIGLYDTVVAKEKQS